MGLCTAPHCCIKRGTSHSSSMYQWAPAMAINRKALPTSVLVEVLLFCRCLIYMSVSKNVYTMHVHGIMMPAKLQGEQNRKQGSLGIVCI